MKRLILLACPATAVGLPAEPALADDIDFFDLNDAAEAGVPGVLVKRFWAKQRKYDCRRPGVTRICFYEQKHYRSKGRDLVSIRCDPGNSDFTFRAKFWYHRRPPVTIDFRGKASSVINKCSRPYLLTGRVGGRGPRRSRLIYQHEWRGDLGGAFGMDNVNETLHRR